MDAAKSTPVAEPRKRGQGMALKGLLVAGPIYYIVLFLWIKLWLRIPLFSTHPGLNNALFSYSVQLAIWAMLLILPTIGGVLAYFDRSCKRAFRTAVMTLGFVPVSFMLFFYVMSMVFRSGK